MYSILVRIEERNYEKGNTDHMFLGEEMIAVKDRIMRVLMLKYKNCTRVFVEEGEVVLIHHTKLQHSI